MKYIILFFFSFGSCFLIGQATDIRIAPTDQSESSDYSGCYNIELDYHGDEVALASQNYRIFYSSASLLFNEEKSGLVISPDDYTFNVVQHNQGIDASGIGELSFESNLGFINATILFKDPRLAGQRLTEDEGWTSIVRFCFEATDATDVGNPEVILARKDLTAPYGRAFVELSVVDGNESIAALPIKTYTDLK